jgi:hypothetical protein
MFLFAMNNSPCRPCDAVEPRARRSVALVALLLPCLGQAQTFSQQGYVDTALTAYPQTVPGDSGQLVSASRFHWEPTAKWSEWHLNAALDAWFDSHLMATRTLAVSYWDRESQRPAFDIQRLSVSWARGPVTIEFGKQFVRWGKTDILTPTDRFAPRDDLSVIDTEVLAETAGRVTVANQSDSLDLVYTPRMTPSRMPLLNQRWAVVPEEIRSFPLVDAGAQYPGGGQYGVRWNHLGRHLEYSLSFFRGFNHSPLLQADFVPASAHIEVRRDYPQLQTIGADAAIPLRWFTIKAESAWFRSNTPQADEYVLYVVQAERQSGEWLFIGGYTGEYVTERRNSLSFDPDRGLAKAFVGRASLTIDTRRSLVFEGVARQNGKGFYGKFEYSHAFGQHWRITPRVGIIRGSEGDFLGQYRRNSFVNVTIRYSF